MFGDLFTKNGLAISGQIIRILEQPNVFKSKQNDSLGCRKTLGTKLLPNNLQRTEISTIICEKWPSRIHVFGGSDRKMINLLKIETIEVFFFFFIRKVYKIMSINYS